MYQFTRVQECHQNMEIKMISVDPRHILESYHKFKCTNTSAIYCVRYTSIMRLFRSTTESTVSPRMHLLPKERQQILFLMISSC